MKKLTILFASALLALALVAPASAAMVDEWHWEYNAVFWSWADSDDPGGSNVTGSEDDTLPGTVTPKPTKLSWGGGYYGPSYIEIDPVVYGDSDYNTIVTDSGVAETTAYMTHFNWPISGPTLTWGLVKSTFKLTPDSPPADQPDAAHTAELEFLFFETPNAEAEDAVVDWYSEDIFILLDIAPTEEHFWYNGFEYVFNFQGSFDVIDQAYIDHLVYNLGKPLDPTQTYFGWVTPEMATTTFEAKALVNSVPEPSTFILLGAGLLGLVGIARRRRS